MTKHTNHQPPPNQVLPTFTTTDPATSSLPPAILDELNDLLLGIGQMHIEYLEMKNYLQRIGHWKKFRKTFRHGWKPSLAIS